MYTMPREHHRTRKRKNNHTKASSVKKKASRVPSVEPGSALRASSISCECQRSAGRRRCSASPEPDRPEGKENERKEAEPTSKSCGVMELRPHADNMFPDDDSNHILPVEHFFGNLDALQDVPQRSRRVHRGHRRRHYYAPEDSDDDQVEQEPPPTAW